MSLAPEENMIMLEVSFFEDDVTKYPAEELVMMEVTILENEIVDIEFEEMPSIGVLDVEPIFESIYGEGHPWNVS